MTVNLGKPPKAGRWSHKLQHFKERKRFHTLSEEVLPWFAKKLRRQAWNYRPADPHGAHYAVAAPSKQALKNRRTRKV